MVSLRTKAAGGIQPKAQVLLYPALAGAEVTRIEEAVRQRLSTDGGRDEVLF